MRATAGRPLPFVQYRLDEEAGGELQVRGPWVAQAYFKHEGQAAFTADGWFDTGDIATIDPEGYLRLTDRAKDVIKSGGEWISTLDLEDAVCSHPAVAMAAAVGVPHPKWDERPLLIIVLKQGQRANRAEILKFLDGKIAKWWMPDDVIFVDEIPHGPTGKIQKIALRERYGKHRLKEAAE